MTNCLKLTSMVTTLCFVSMLVSLPVRADDDDGGLPPDPGKTPIPEDQAWAYGTTGEEDLAGEEPYDGDVVCVKVGLGAPALQVEGLFLLPGGVLLSEQKALRCADYKIAYKELRLLYEIDLEAWAEKEKVYQKQLERADKEIVKLDRKLNSTWSRYKFGIGMGLGFLLAVVMSVCTMVIVVRLM